MCFDHPSFRKAREQQHRLAEQHRAAYIANQEEAFRQFEATRVQPQEQPDVEDADWREIPAPQLPAT